MNLPILLPTDDVIVAILGVEPYWSEIVPYLDILGYLAWYLAGAVLMVPAALVPRLFVSPVMAALATGVVIKLAEVYSWGRLSYVLQLLMFLAATIVFETTLVVLHRRRHKIVVPDRPG